MTRERAQMIIVMKRDTWRSHAVVEVSLSDTVIISISFVNVITSLFPFGMTTRKDEKIIEENVRSFPPVASASVIHPLFLLAELNRRTD